MQLALGAALVTRGVDIAAAVSGRQATPPGWLIRVLGARSVVQGIVGLAYPTRQVALGGAAVDVTHALTMVAAAALFPDYRRAAVASGSVAVASAVCAGTLTV